MDIAADNLDRLLTVEMRRRGRSRGFKWSLYSTARTHSDQLLVLAAARALDHAPCLIAIVTGAQVPDHMPVGESDGPFGATVMAKSLAAICHKVTIWTDPECARAHGSAAALSQSAAGQGRRARHQRFSAAGGNRRQRRDPRYHRAPRQ